jgi:Putative actin-like family
MAFKPEFSSVHPVFPIQTANKNIYSYFMKNDSSYYVSPEQRYQKYRLPTDKTYVLAITGYRSRTGEFSCTGQDRNIEIDCILGCEQGAVREVKGICVDEIQRRVGDMERDLPGTEDIKKSSEVFIAISFPDALNRRSVVGLVRSLINHQKFKGVLVVPRSLSVSLGLNLPSCLVVRRGLMLSVSGIEDNCVVQEFPAERGTVFASSLEEEDFAEEFGRKEVPAEGMSPAEFVCSLCGEKYFLEEFTLHFETHGMDLQANQAEGEDVLFSCQKVPEKGSEEDGEEQGSSERAGEESVQEMLSGMAERLGSRERVQKIFSSVVIVGVDGFDCSEEKGAIEECVEKQIGTPPVIMELSEEEGNAAAWKGLHALSSIEPAKELWLTDKEWESVGLRVLKEKLLFMI